MGKRIQGKYKLIVPGLVLMIAGGMIFFRCNGSFCREQENKTAACDINHDGTDEIITLYNRKLSITDNGNLLWEAQEEWEVTDFLIADINKDGWEEILILLWKQGSFGEHAPFWEEDHTDDEPSQHIFIYQWSGQEQRIKPLWMSSRLKPRIQSWNMTEDGKIHIITDKNEDTLWIWGKWGLERVQEENE